MFDGPRPRLAAGVVVVLVLAGCRGGDDGPTAAPSPSTTVAAPTSTPAPSTTAAPARQLAATAKVPRLEIFNAPVQPEPAKVLDNPQPDGAAPGFTLPLRMLVVEDRGEWLKVLLPVRPNGSSGWIRRSTVDVEPREFRILVELGAHRITVWKGDEVVLQEPVGVGASGRTPTTQGLFYTMELYEVIPSERAIYGPFAFSLSGYSEVHYSFGNGGTGVLGIHGTSDTSSLGRDVSNGCIRMANASITKLAELLPPWGVPVEIKA